MAVNPATQPSAEPVEGDNLTQEQASLILAVFTADPDAVLDSATDLEMSEDEVDDLLTMLADMAGAPDTPDASDDDEAEADPDDMEAQ
jgi:hypothetical protein